MINRIRRALKNDRGELGLVPVLLIVWSLVFFFVLLPMAAEEDEENAQSKMAVKEIEDDFGITILGDPKIAVEVDDITAIKINRNDEVLSCDVAVTEEETFIVSCDSPTGRITLEEK